MKDAIHMTFARIREKASPNTPIVLLHIGQAQTCVASGSGKEPDQIIVLEMGASRTSSAFFKHNPPLPLEIENAIMAVEDEVTRARAVAMGGVALLYLTDQWINDMTHMLGHADAMAIPLKVEEVESLFDQLAARSEGRLASQVDIPDDPRFAAALLILREFMHHLNFDQVQYAGKLAN